MYVRDLLAFSGFYVSLFLWHVDVEKTSCSILYVVFVISLIIKYHLEWAGGEGGGGLSVDSQVVQRKAEPFISVVGM